MLSQFLDPVVALFEEVPAWQATALLLGLSLGMALVLEVVVLRGLLRYTAGTKTDYDHILVSELRPPLVVTAGLAGVFLLTQISTVADEVLLTTGQLNTFFGKPSLSIIVVVWAYAANRVVNRFVAEAQEEGQQFDLAPVLSNVWTLVVVIATGGALLRIWQYSITPLLGAAGIAGIAIGFAAKDTVANFFGGIALYFDDTYKLGDYVELDSGEAGTVVKVGVRSTTLMTRDEVLIVVPNSVLNSAKVINQSAPQRRRRLKLPIGVAYGTDVDEFEELVLEIAREEDLVLDDRRPRMRFRRFGDSALEYELVCWVRSPMLVGRARHKLLRAIYKRLQAAEIEIPYPQQDVHIRGTATAGPDGNGTRVAAATDRDAGAPAEPEPTVESPDESA